MKTLLSRLPIDPYIASILGMVALASALPAHGVRHDAGQRRRHRRDRADVLPAGRPAGAAGGVGRRAALAAARGGAGSTFLLFPALGLTARAIAPELLTPPLWAGLLMLCLLPSTVQSSIAFTSIARGNVAAALCAATASNLLGILLTPLLAGLLLQRAWRLLGPRVGDIVVQLLLPFAAGQLARPLIGEWVGRRKALIGLVDRGSILLVVYVAFSEGVTHGIWHQLDAAAIRHAAAAGCGACWLPCCWRPAGMSRLLGFSRADQITIVFCGSKKSLASGLPMASVLFAGQSVGLIVLPLMLFHQIQLMVCAALARRYAAAPMLGQQPMPRLAASGQ